LIVVLAVIDAAGHQDSGNGAVFDSDGEGVQQVGQSGAGVDEILVSVQIIVQEALPVRVGGFLLGGRHAAFPVVQGFSPSFEQGIDEPARGEWMGR
jgi:hypothetical protein